MPIELPVNFKNVLEAMGESLTEGVYQPVLDELVFPQGDTLAERFPEVYDQLRLIANSLGIDFDATNHTFTVTKSRNNGKVYINYPGVRLVDEVPTLCWGEVKRPIAGLDCKALNTKTVASVSNKPGARPKHYLEVKLNSKDWKAIGVTTVMFPLSTVDDVDPMLLASAVDCEPESDEYKQLWSQVLRAQSVGNFKPFAKSLGHIFHQHPELSEYVDDGEFYDAIDSMCAEATCEPLAVRVVVADAEIEDGRFGQSLVMTLDDIESKHSYGRFKTSLKTALGRRFDPKAPEDFTGTEFTIVAEGVGEMNGKAYVKTRVEELVMGCTKDGLPSWGSVRGF